MRIHLVTRAGFIVLIVAALFAPAAEAGSADRSPSGRGVLAGMTGRAADEGEPVRLTFVRARYEVDVLGSIAVGTLVQEFRNDSEQDLTATYSLLQPGGLEPGSMRMEVDGELLEDVIRSEEAPESGEKSAKNKQQQNKKPGDRKSAGLSSKSLEIGAGGTVTVQTAFRVDVPLENGRLRLRLPAVFAQQGTIAKESPRRAGAARPTRQNRRPLQEEERAVPLSLTVNVHHEEHLLDVDSKTHKLMVSYQGDRTIVEPARMESDDGRDFEILFTIGSEYDATLLAYAGPEREDGLRQVVVVLSPPASPWEESIRAKEVLFVLDTSGSMRAEKLDQARAAIDECLDKLGGDDLYNIVEFDTSYTMLNPEPVSTASMSPAAAEGWLEQQEAGGGTQLLPALTATFQQAESRDRHRMIVVVTDGMMVDEEQVLEALKEKLGAGRLFVVGIGRDVNRPVVNRLAEFGRGTAVFATDSESLEPVVERLFDSVASPLAWDLELDWAGAEVESMQPARLSDLYAGRPVKLVAHIRGMLPEEISLRGLTTEGDRTWTAAVKTLPGDALRGLPAPQEPATPARKSPRKQKPPESR